MQDLDAAQKLPFRLVLVQISEAKDRAVTLYVWNDLEAHVFLHSIDVALKSRNRSKILSNEALMLSARLGGCTIQHY